jgi:transcriptional regulator with XRE-family HTH domain
VTKQVPNPPTKRTELGAWLADLRLGRANLNQVQLAGVVGLSQRAVIRWEDGEVPEAVATFLRWLEVAGVKLVPAPPLGERMDAAAERIEQAVRVLEEAAAQLDGSLSESRPPHEAG